MVLKRIFDIFFASFGLLLFSPLFIVIPVLIKIDSRGPAIFKQLRVGQNGKLFYAYKFRSMIHGADKQGIRLTGANDLRVTRLGRVLRKYKIDELPQLANVLKGEMSFVGPRPELPEYVDLFPEDYDIILKVKPGITDYASIKFWDESKLMQDADNKEEVYVNEILPRKIELYKEYVKKMSFFLDLRIIFSTLFSWIKRGFVR